VSVCIAVPSLVHADVYTWHYDDGSTRAVCFIAWPNDRADLVCVRASPVSPSYIIMMIIIIIAIIVNRFV